MGSHRGWLSVVDWSSYEAVLFDLDGVLTDTARLHARAWKITLDRYLAERSPGAPEFTAQDYLALVDGRPRYEGVAAFLASRGVELPWGSPGDPPGLETICGIGNRKNEVVGELLATEGVDVYAGSRLLLDRVTSLGLKLAIVSSSANAAKVLRAAGIEHYFTVRVDGQLAAERGIPGKPDPAPFLTAAEMLGAAPKRTVVIEDATSGVKAGKRGGFGLVIGVSRHGEESRLLAAGADLAVEDLGELA